MAKEVHQSQGLTVRDAHSCTDVNGRDISKGSAPYKYLIGGDMEKDAVARETRVEVKSARMTWIASKQCWRMRFQGVKKDEHDDLLLGALWPSGADLWKYNWQTSVGLAAQGVGTAARGNNIEFVAPKGLHDPTKAREYLQTKLQNAATRLESRLWSHPGWQTSNIHVLSPGDAAYCHSQDPLRQMFSAATRGNYLEQFCR
eukprot:5860300-Amphidinium_carterae.1